MRDQQLRVDVVTPHQPAATDPGVTRDAGAVKDLRHPTDHGRRKLPAESDERVRFGKVPGHRDCLPRERASDALHPGLPSHDSVLIAQSEPC